MPKGKRNRKNRRKRKHCSKSNQVSIYETPQKCENGDSNFGTLPNLTSILKTINNTPTSLKRNNLSTKFHLLVSVTPKSVNKKSNELIAVNLCKLFDDEFTEIENVNNATPKRVATQTVYFDNSAEKNNSNNKFSDIYLQNCINIFETPKISQMEKLEKAFELQTPSSQVLQTNNKDINASNEKQNFKRLFDYKSPHIRNNLKNNESDLETSIFSRQIRTSSTPIEKEQKYESIFESITKNKLNAPLDCKILQRREKVGRREDILNSTLKTPKNKKLYENKLFTEEINKIENYVYKERMYKSVSPKKLKDTINKLNNTRNTSFVTTHSPKNDNNIPKTFSPQRISFNRSDNFLSVLDSNAYNRFRTNIKKFHNRYTSKWWSHINDICGWFGITIKTRFPSLYTTIQINSNMDTSDATLCPKICSTCKEYKRQISDLTVKIYDIDKEMHERMNNLNKELCKMKQEILEKLNDVEEQLKVPPVLQIPPPPPPPLPPPPLPAVTVGKLAAISLPDDILNVKLKKTPTSFNRTGHTSPGGQRSRSYL